MQAPELDMLDLRHAGPKTEPDDPVPLILTDNRASALYHRGVSRASPVRSDALGDEVGNGMCLIDFSIRDNGVKRPRSQESASGETGKEKMKDVVDAFCRPNNAQPTRFSFLSSSFDSVIQATSVDDLLSQAEGFRDPWNTEERRGAWWLDVMDPSEQDIEALSRTFAIHPLTTEDIMTGEPREKIELFENYYFLSLCPSQRLEKGADQRKPTLNVYAIVFHKGILSFTFSTSSHAANVRYRIKELRNHLNLTSDWICYALIDDIVDGFAALICELEREIVAMEDNFSISRLEDLSLALLQIHECRKRVNGVRHLLGGKVDVIRSFARRCDEYYSIAPSSELGLYLSDIQDHVVTMMSNLIHFEQMLSRAHANLLGRLSVDSTRTGSRTIRALSKISIIAAILVPMHFLTGLFGMNVPVPGGESIGLTCWYGILGGIGTIIILSLIIVRMTKLI